MGVLQKSPYISDNYKIDIQNGNVLNMVFDGFKKMLHGVSKFYKNGVLVEESTFYKGRRHGSSYTYNEKGLSHKNTFVLNKLFKTIEYDQSKTNLTIKSEFLFFSKSCLKFVYFEDGSISEQLQFKKDVLDRWRENGEIRTYHKNGKLESLRKYDMGTLNGVFQIYNETGALSVSGNYDIGVKVGLWRFYNDDGRVIKTVNY